MERSLLYFLYAFRQLIILVYPKKYMLFSKHQTKEMYVLLKGQGQVF